MNIKYKRAVIENSNLLISIYNNAFYDDFIKFKECPGYGKTKTQMEYSIIKYPKDIIFFNDIPVGVISFQMRDDNIYFIGAFAIIKEYQRRKIGSYTLSYYENKIDWKLIYLITPLENYRTVNFYHQCGYQNGDIFKDGNVEVITLYKRR